MMTPLLRALTGATALVGALTLATQAAAQETATTWLDRIILGLGGYETVAIDTPQAVTVLNQEDIDRVAATTVGELFDQIPGIQAIGSGRVAGESFNIRGIGSLAASDESKIIVTVDGATNFYEQYRMGSFFSDPELYKQVEVLRGPASSTLYGAGALGGVINFETKDAADFIAEGHNSALRVRTSYESNSNEVLGSLIFATAPTDNFDTLVQLNYRQADDYEDGDGNAISGSEFAAISGLVKSNLYFGDDSQQQLTLSYTQRNSDLDDTDYSQTGTAGFGTIDRDKTDQTLALRYQNSVPGNPLWDLDVVLSYVDSNTVQSDSSVGQFSLFADSEYGYTTTSLKAQNTFDLSRGNMDHYLIAGVQVSSQDRLAQSAVGVLGYHPEGTDLRAGVFVQSEMVWDNGLTLVSGLRADQSYMQPGDGVPAEDVKNIAISPKIAAHYQVNDTFAVFGSLAQTERSATLDELFSFDSTDGETAAVDLNPETARSVEFGVASSFHSVLAVDDVLQFKSTAFYSDIDDLIARDSEENTPYYRNIGSATIYGVELEAAYQADQTYARLAYSDVRGFDNDTDETLSSIPARTLALTLGQRNEQLGLDYGWRGQLVDAIDYGGGVSYDAYAVHDLYVSWAPQNGALEGFDIQFTVDNAFDTTYENSLAGDFGAGRSFGITLTRAIDL